MFNLQLRIKKMNKIISNFFFKKYNKSSLQNKQFYFFLCAIFQSAFIFIVADKTDLFNEIIFIVSIVAVAIFIAFTFIASKGVYKITLLSIILFSALLVLDGITNYVILLKGIIAIVVIYIGLIHSLIEIKNSTLQNIHQ